MHRPLLSTVSQVASDTDRFWSRINISGRQARGSRRTLRLSDGESWTECRGRQFVCNGGARGIRGATTLSRGTDATFPLSIVRLALFAELGSHLVALKLNFLGGMRIVT